MKFNPILIALLTVATAAPIAEPNAEAAPFRCAGGKRCFGNGWNVWKRDVDETEATEAVEEPETVEESDTEKREAAPFRCAGGKRCFGNGWNVWKRDVDETEATEAVEEPVAAEGSETVEESDTEKREAAPFRCAGGKRCFGNGWNVWKREDGFEEESA